MSQARWSGVAPFTSKVEIQLLGPVVGAHVGRRVRWDFWVLQNHRQDVDIARVTEADQLADGALLPLLHAGDHAAHGALFDRYGQLVYGFCARRCGDRGRAEDMLSIVFLEVWRCRTWIVLVDESLRPWLLASCAPPPRCNTHRSTATGQACVQEPYIGCLTRCWDPPVRASGPQAPAVSDPAGSAAASGRSGWPATGLLAWWGTQIVPFRQPPEASGGASSTSSGSCRPPFSGALSTMEAATPPPIQYHERTGKPARVTRTRWIRGWGLLAGLLASI